MAIIYSVFAGFAYAQPRVLDLVDRHGSYDVAPYTEYFEDINQSLTFEDIQVKHADGAFLPVNGSIDFGSKAANFWLHMTVRNSSDQIQDWVLNTGSQRMRHARMYFITNEGPEMLHLDDQAQPFHDRPVNHRLLLAELILEPGEQVEIFVTYRSAKSSYFPLKIMHPEEFELWDKQQVQMIILVLGAMLILAIYSVFLFFTVGNLSYIFYLVFISSTFLYLLHQFGFAFAYLWPQSPAFNSLAANMFGYISAGSGLLFGRSFFQVPKINRYLNWFYLLIAALIVTGFTLIFIWSNSVTLGTMGFMLGAISGLLNLVVAVICYRRGDNSAGLAAIGWGALIGWGIIINVNSFGISQIPEQLIFDNFYMIHAVSALTEVIFLTLSLIVRIRDIISSSQREREAYIALLEGEAATARTLALAMQDKQAAIEDAARKGRLVESMAHDIRQPLHAMKLTSYSDQKSKSNAVANEAINMIEGVLTTAFAAAETDEIEKEIYLETVSLQNIFLPLSLVFSPEAREQGLTLRVLPSSAEVTTDRRVLMRIMNNLVANAIRYTEKGTILVGCRRRKEGIAIQILDTGIGMSADDIDAAITPYIRLNPEIIPEGRGLGLTICRRLCEQISAELTIRSEPGKGTVAEVLLPYIVTD